MVQILDLMVHSLYSNKEIFLRELISNASDAIDRLRLELLAKSELPEAEGPLQIRVCFDKDARTITVADNGIGMSRQEVIDHIGTIAKSGTREFLSALTGDQRKDASLIGQFGVGFYSAFIVADRVTLTTRRSGLDGRPGRPLGVGRPRRLHAWRLPRSPTGGPPSSCTCAKAKTTCSATTGCAASSRSTPTTSACPS